MQFLLEGMILDVEGVRVGIVTLPGLPPVELFINHLDLRAFSFSGELLLIFLPKESLLVLLDDLH